MTAAPSHPRALIERLFETGDLTPAQWDETFAHLRTCKECSTFYDEKRAAKGVDPAEPVSSIESAAMLRTLRRRAADARARRVSWRQRGTWVAALATTCAALLLIVPKVAHHDPDGGVTERGGEDADVGAKMVCAPARKGAIPRDVELGCPAGGDLVVEAVAAKRVAAAAVSIALVDGDLRLVRIRSEKAVPDEVARVPASLGDVNVRVFVLWSASPISPATVETALMTAKERKTSLADLSTLPIEGVLAQKSSHVIEVRREGAN